MSDQTLNKEEEMEQPARDQKVLNSAPSAAQA